MTVYVDSSVLLRIIDSARIRLALTDPHVAERRAAILHHLEAFDLIPVDTAVLERAAEPFPTLLGTLDAVHLASAVLVRAVLKDLVFATHDRELAVAAQAMGFRVLGAPES